ncbi:MAG TPA: hypothetical protein VH417_06940 [Vicinamibacterales bacterium]
MHARLTEISTQLNQLRHPINGLALNDDLRAALRQEQVWLERAEVVLSQLRSFREQDALRFWPGVLRRWALHSCLLSDRPPSPATRGPQNPAQEIKVLRTRMEFVEFVERRVVT